MKTMLRCLLFVLAVASVSQLPAATRTWSGLGGTAFWNTPGNWVANIPPTTADDVLFPAGASTPATLNNLNGAARSIIFGGGGFSISGSAMVLTNGVNATNSSGGNVLNFAITLGANQSFTNLQPGTQLVFLFLDLASRSATFRGAGTNLMANGIHDSVGGGSLTNLGTGVFRVAASNSFTGPTALSAGTNLFTGIHRRSPITWTAGTLGGTGSLGQVTAFGATAKRLVPGLDTTGILNVSNLVLSSSVTVVMRVNGYYAGDDYHQIVVSNNLTLGSAALNLSFLNTFSPPFGVTFKLIDMAGTNLPSGIFAALPEGSRFTNNGVIYALTYSGGDGNDVALEVVESPFSGSSRIWTGGSGSSSNWTDAANWSGSNLPQPGDNLIFPNTADRRTNFNDFPDRTTFGLIQFQSPGGSFLLNYTLLGRSVLLNDGVRLVPTSSGSTAMTGAMIVSNHITLTRPQIFTNAFDADLRISGGIELGTNTLSADPRGNTDIFFDRSITGPGVFTQNGSSIGRVTLLASNHITGTLLANVGIVFALNAQALGISNSGPTHVSSSGTLRLSAPNSTITGSLLVVTGKVEFVSLNSSFSGRILAGGTNGVLTGGSGTFPLSFITNSTRLTVSNTAGIFRLPPAAAIQGGGVLVSKGNFDADGFIRNFLSLENGGTLTGSGQIDFITHSNGIATIQPGSLTDALLAYDPLRVGQLRLSTFTTVNFDLFPNRPGGGNTNTSFTVTNAPALSNATLEVTASTNLSPNQAFILIRNNSTAPVTNTFKNLPEGAFLAASGGNLGLRISYVGGTGNDVVLTVQSNTPPMLFTATNFATPTTLSVTESNLLSFTNIVADFEQPPQPRSWTFITVPPAGLTINPTNGIITWTPMEDQAPFTNTYFFRVTDSGTPPLSATGVVTIVTAEFNLAPVPTPVPTTNVIAANTLTMQLTATDADIPANSLTWAPLSLPAGAAIASDGLFTYTPPLATSGNRNVQVSVRDFNPQAINQTIRSNTLSFTVQVLSRRIVINTNDSGVGSLRQAILEVNTNSLGGEIDFAIPGTGPFKIAPLTPLPLLNVFTLVDGYTQTNAQPNTLTNGNNAVLMIELSGENIPGSAGLSWVGHAATIRGLCVNRFSSGTGLSSGCASCGGNTTPNSIIEGCFIGTDITGSFARPNNQGIVFAQTYNSRIGGPEVAQRNVISGNLFNGINPFQGFDGQFLFGLTIQNNFIGTDRTGTNAIGNGNDGIAASTGGVGGPGFDGRDCLIADNVICANGHVGITWGSVRNRFLRNKIGVGANGVTPLGNTLHGMDLFTSDCTIGGTNVADGNIVAFNGSAGIHLFGGSSNLVAGNSIFRNTGLAIDLENVGRNNNDASDNDSGPNGLQNFPVLNLALPLSGGLTIAGTLSSKSNTTYRIEIFHSQDFAPGGKPQAAQLLGVTSVTTDNSGAGSFFINTSNLPPGGLFTATATDPFGSTSEISDGLPFLRLNISRTNSLVRVSWNNTLTNFTLQSNSNINNSNTWSNVSGANSNDGQEFFRLFNPTSSPSFFRLRGP